MRAAFRGDLRRSKTGLPDACRDGVQDARRMTYFVSGADECLHVLRKARAAVPRTRIDEAVTDTRVGTDAQAHLLYVSAQALGNVRQLVHEADLGGEHGV